jgi:hypothetical protein
MQSNASAEKKAADLPVKPIYIMLVAEWLLSHEQLYDSKPSRSESRSERVNKKCQKNIFGKRCVTQEDCDRD